MMKRREFISLLGGAAAAWPVAARAQQPAMPTIGFLGSEYAGGTDANGRSLLCSGCANWAGSRVVPSRSNIAGRRDAMSVSRRSPPSLSGSRSMPLSRREPGNTEAKQATSVIPIVATIVGDPVGSGLVASLALPGGNVTGLSVLSVDMAAKRLELLREAVPDFRRLAILFDVGNPVSVEEARRFRRRPAARA